MILLLHGDDIVKSRQYLQDFKKSEKFDEIKVYSSNDINLTDLTNQLANQSLIACKRLIIIENLFKNTSFELKNFKIIDQDVDLVIWEDRLLAPTKIKQIEKVGKEYQFKIEPLIFKYLDAIYPGNVKNSLELLKILIKKEDGQFIFAMLIRHFRTLFLASTPSGLDSLKRQLADWQLSKFVFQSKKFNTDKIKKSLELLLDIDIKVKSGSVSGIDQELVDFTYRLTKTSSNR